MHMSSDTGQLSGREQTREELVYDQQGKSPQDLESYQLARDRQRRIINAPHWLGYADLMAYALLVAKYKDEVDHWIFTSHKL